MIPGSKGQKSDTSLLAGGFLNLGPAKNVGKKPFLEEKMSGLRINIIIINLYKKAAALPQPHMKGLTEQLFFYIHKTGTGLIYVNNRPDMQNPPTR